MMMNRIAATALFSLAFAAGPLAAQAPAAVDTTQTKAFLITLRTVEEVYFTDHDGYTDNLSSLRTIAAARFPSASDKAAPTNPLDLPTGVIFTLTVSKTGMAWSGVVKSKSDVGVRCGMAVNTPNPVDGSAGEGAAMCR